MPTDHRRVLARIKRFDQLIAYLRDEMGWPIANGHDFEDLTFEYSPEELGIDPKNAAKIQEIKRLRPLAPNQPWGIFFVKFEPKKLPVVALRRILGQVALKKRASANKSERQAWAADDLLFVSNYGEGEERKITFAHFSKSADDRDLPTLKVLGWDNLDTALHLDAVARELTEHLAWPENESDFDAWRQQWQAAFTLRHLEVVTTSTELSLRLAALARAIRDRIKAALAIETETGPLTLLMKAFQEALVHDLDAEGFADMYAQTIAYGLLSARMVDPSRRTADDFAGHMHTNPFLRELMETFLKVGGRRGKAGGLGIDFDELGVSEVIELLDGANMEAVVRDFGDKNPLEDPVIHFYELFLKEYDAKKRMQRGVFYTPRPVVSYIVRSMDELLQTEFGLEDGLADTANWRDMAKRHSGLRIPDGVSPDQDFVQILDPATGTGTFLVEVIELIYKRVVAKWKTQGLQKRKIEELWNEYVPEHLLPRLHGYELLMAPYAIAHLKVGLKLYETGYRFGSDERVRVYLTNALEPAHDFAGTFSFAIPALAHEALSVNEIKQKRRFTVVIGNPPYSKLSANLSDEVRALVEPYRYFDGKRIRERGALQLEMNLQDDYVKFIRLCETAIYFAGGGVAGFISNRGYLENPTLRGMRWSLATTFSSISFLDLRGHQASLHEGSADENVFDIRQGVAIAVAVRSLTDVTSASELAFWAFVGPRAEKYRYLGATSASTVSWEELQPKSPQFKFVPIDSGLEHEFMTMVGLGDLFPVNSAGFISSRDGLVVGVERQPLVNRIVAFASDSRSDSEIYESYGFGPSKRFDLKAAQRSVRQDRDMDASMRPCLYRPFDRRWVYYNRELIESFKPIAFNFSTPEDLALLATRQVTRSNYEHAFVTRHMAEIKVCSHDRNTQVFPLFLRDSSGEPLLSQGPAPNLNHGIFGEFAAALGLRLNGSTRGLGLSGELSPLSLFYYAYAILYSPSYRDRYFAFLRSDFPRLPLIGNLDLFRALATCPG